MGRGPKRGSIEHNKKRVSIEHNNTEHHGTNIDHLLSCICIWGGAWLYTLWGAKVIYIIKTLGPDQF